MAHFLPVQRLVYGGTYARHPFRARAYRSQCTFFPRLLLNFGICHLMSLVLQSDWLYVSTLHSRHACVLSLYQTVRVPALD